MKTIGLIEKQIVTQIVVRTVRVEDGTPVNVEAWDELLTKAKNQGVEQKIVLGQMTGPRLADTWKSDASTAFLKEHGASDEAISALDAIHPRDLTVLSIIAKKSGTTKIVKALLVSTLSPLAQAIGRELLTPGSSLDPETQERAAAIVRFVSRES